MSENIVSDLVHNRNKTIFLVHRISKKKNKNKTLKNGVSQGSVLAPILFNICLGYMPSTGALKFGYANDGGNCSPITQF